MKRNQLLSGNSAFTLIELSIVMVIIGLLVGGVLVGRDLIDAALVLKQISQIDKYEMAVQAFQGKYGYLPGDIPDPSATQYGFIARNGSARGDGNNVIQGSCASYCGNGGGINFSVGEVLVFWVDLSTAGLIDGSFTTGNNTVSQGATTSQVSLFFPKAKIGNGNYVYVYSGWYPDSAYVNWSSDSVNYFGLSQVTGIQYSTYGALANGAGLTVMQANNIDKKIDDGLPTTGSVRAALPNATGPNYFYWASTSIGFPASGVFSSAVSASSSTCFDNGGNASVAPTYSILQNNGTGVNCALQFIPPF